LSVAVTKPFVCDCNEGVVTETDDAVGSDADSVDVTSSGVDSDDVTSSEVETDDVTDETNFRLLNIEPNNNDFVSLS
jgi:hypothetical protein